MISPSAMEGLLSRIELADTKYGPPASTHEALGVAIEEWDELRAAIHANGRSAIRHEALDLAAILIRLHDALESDSICRRSGLV